MLVKKYRDQIKELSEVLLKKETIDLTDITNVLGPRPFILKENFRAYLEESIRSWLIYYNDFKFHQINY